MCMKNNKEESCEVATNLAALAGRVGNLETRMDNIEGSITIGFTQVNTAVQQLATDFGQRMNTLDLRIVEEKAKWGDTLRGILVKAVYVILGLAATAGGMTCYKAIFGN